MARIALALAGIAKTHGATPVLRGIDLEIVDGELFVLLGPSGCGKTTLLRAVAGLVAIDAGRVRLGDRDITTLPAEDRNIAMVFQDYALYPHMTVWDNLAFGLKRHRVPKAEISQRIVHVTRMLNIDGLVRRKPHQLSGGQQQRVALGRAIVREPALFLMDEPLSNLDAQVRANTRAELKQLQRRLGTSTLYVTHDQVEAMTLADRLGVMNHGRLEQVGPPLEVYRMPATLFIAQFLSSPRLNLLQGEVIRDGGEVAVRTALAVFPLDHVGATASPRVQVGVRPEWLRLTPKPLTDSAALNIELIEPLGAEVLIHVRRDDLRLVARAPAESIGSDQTQLWIDSAASRVDLFDDADRRIPF
jgi:ABC-type sugar transport system ATPase subunit